MKSVLIIGLGRFGHRLAANMLEKGNDVMVVDWDEQKIADLVPYATSARICDCTKPEVLQGLGIRNFDIVFVCIGTNFQSSLEITSQAKELGAKKVVSKATRDIQAKFLLRNGADEVIYPEKDIAEKCAVQYSFDQIFDYMEMTDGYGIYEIRPLKNWIGRNLRESNIAAKHRVSIVGVKRGDGSTQIMPSADYVIKETDHLMVLAQDKILTGLLRKL